MKYRPKLDPKVDLADATPETLARAGYTSTYRGKSPSIGAYISD